MKIQSRLIALFAISVTMFVSCKNGDVDFPDYDGGITVYFPYQYPVRTLVMGTDEYDTSVDKEHCCVIQSTMGGTYGGRDITVNVDIDETLCDGLSFSDGSPVKPMPENYYEFVDGQQLKYDGTRHGKMKVHFTDAFFADPASATTTYVIPLVMTSQTGADQILVGEYDKEAFSTAPARTSDDWTVRPMDYVLYCVTYKSKYDAFWSRSGELTVGDKTIVHPNPDDFASKTDFYDPVVNGEDCQTKTIALNKVSYVVSYNVNGFSVNNCELILTFDDNDNCTIESNTSGVTVTGNGKYTKDGAVKAWGNKDRDIINLEYVIVKGDQQLKVKDQLVWKRSGVSVEEFMSNE